MKDIEKFLVYLDSTVEEVISAIQKGGQGIAIVVDQERCPIKTITDGDVRRAILNKVRLEDKVTILFKNDSRPVVASVKTSQDELLKMMEEKVLRQIPLLNDEGRIVELVLLSELIEERKGLSLTAVVMAGGKGKRLYPLTKGMPKPMLPVDGVPLMHRIVQQLHQAGIKKIQISTHYKSDVITNYFGDGQKLGINIDYIHEDQPLGTAGALGLMDIPTETALIINGDILTQLDFRAIYDFHQTHGAIMTVGLRKFEFEVPYGVVQTDDIHITHLVEKPLQTFLVNAGIYLIEPLVYEYIPKEKYLDMTDLISALLKAKLKVISFPIQEYWLDVGLREDYKKAQEDVKSGKI